MYYLVSYPFTSTRANSILCGLTPAHPLPSPPHMAAITKLFLPKIPLAKFLL